MRPTIEVAQTCPKAPLVPSRETLLLPVCCICGLIRDETGASLHREHWVTEGTYRKKHGFNPSDCLLTHTYCPACYAQVMNRIRAALAERPL
jgi:hypothetical protein